MFFTSVEVWDQIHDIIVLIDCETNRFKIFQIKNVLRINLRFKPLVIEVFSKIYIIYKKTSSIAPFRQNYGTEDLSQKSSNVTFNVNYELNQNFKRNSMGGCKKIRTGRGANAHARATKHNFLRQILRMSLNIFQFQEHLRYIDIKDKFKDHTITAAMPKRTQIANKS